MSLSVEPPILASEDCFNCRKCCKYEPDELMDAPMFTEEQRLRAETEFRVKNLRFEQRGKLWQVVLDDIPRSDKKICPFFDADTAHCLVHDYEIFDCLTWPFYIMRVDRKVMITLSPDCPIVIERSQIEDLKRYAKERIGPRTLEKARQHPDLITEYHGNAIVLCDVEEF
ncbi:MAG: hypothetical protein ABIH78_00745 [Candidatus Peregrinibacteria bacterium]